MHGFLYIGNNHGTRCEFWNSVTTFLLCRKRDVSFSATLKKNIRYARIYHQRRNKQMRVGWDEPETANSQRSENQFQSGPAFVNIMSPTLSSWSSRFNARTRKPRAAYPPPVPRLAEYFFLPSSQRYSSLTWWRWQMSTVMIRYNHKI